MELGKRMHQIQVCLLLVCSYLKRMHSCIDSDFDPEVELIDAPAVQQHCMLYSDCN